MVGHAAFLTTPVNFDVERYADYDTAWNNTPKHDEHHDLTDIRAILDRPDLFDFLNIHNLGDPYEIEHQMRWLRKETKRRGYTRPVVISDTLSTSYVAWGAGSRCEGNRLGTLIPPATEKDRCDIAAYFTKLLEGDKKHCNGRASSSPPTRCSAPSSQQSRAPASSTWPS